MKRFAAFCLILMMIPFNCFADTSQTESMIKYIDSISEDKQMEIMGALYSGLEEGREKIVFPYAGVSISTSAETAEKLFSHMKIVSRKIARNKNKSLLALFEENDIYLTLPEMEGPYMQKEDGYTSWYEFSSDIGMQYTIYYDGVHAKLYFYCPKSWNPCKEALILSLSFMLDIDINDAGKLLKSLEYNFITEKSKYITTKNVERYVGNDHIILKDLEVSYMLWIEIAN